MSTQPASARTVLITGTSSGIGLSTALSCARAGWNTVATMRDPARATALHAAAVEAGTPVEVRALDVTDPTSVASCVSAVLADHGRLDAVVNNAGAAFVGTVENVDLAQIRACMEVNYFGVINVTQAVMAHLRASSGRLVTISSVGGVVGQPFNEAYCAAKFAVEGFMQALDPVARTVGVGVAIVEPGAVTSAFVANAGLDVPAMLAAAGPYAPALRAYLQRTLAQFDSAIAQSPEQVARVILDVLTADPMPFRTQTSQWANQFAGTSLTDVDGAAVQRLTRPWVDA